MRRAKFIGDPRHGGQGPDVVSVHGVEFPKGEWVKDGLTDFLFTKLLGNNHFETEGGAVEAPKAAPATPAAPDPEKPASATPEPAVTAPKVLPPDHDGDNIPGGSTKSPEKDAVIAKLEGMGVDFDKRWGLERLKKLAADTEFERFAEGED